jgi:hypothetical protein
MTGMRLVDLYALVHCYINSHSLIHERRRTFRGVLGLGSIVILPGLKSTTAQSVQLILERVYCMHGREVLQEGFRGCWVGFGGGARVLEWDRPPAKVIACPSDQDTTALILHSSQTDMVQTAEAQLQLNQLLPLKYDWRSLVYTDRQPT